MLSVTLVKLPNSPKFLGSFDPSSGDWWYSNLLPGNVEEIMDATWAYGRYHVCFAKMMDNTYSIYQSIDYGVTWNHILNLPYTIYTIFRIDYGRLLCSTSNGIYESRNAGTTWSKISTTANLVTIREVGDDILVGIRSNGAVYRSANRGVSWSSSGVTSRKDCIDGQNGIVLVRHDNRGDRRYLGISQDYGSSYFTGDPAGWYYGNVTVIQWNNDGSINYHFSGYGIGYSCTITKIICTGVDTRGFPTFVIQTKLNDSNILRHYYAQFYYNTTYPAYSRYYFTARFDAIESQSSDLSAKEVLLVGTSSYSRTVVFVGAYSDGRPRVVTSSDGGYTWVNQDVTTATIYSGPDMTQEVATGGAFLEDSYISTAWTGPVCHNSGSWNSSGYIQRGISYDMDFLTRAAVPREQTYSMDIYNIIPKNHNYYMDVLNQKMRERGKLFDILIRDIGQYTYPMDVLNLKIRTNTITMDVLNQKMREKSLLADILNRDTHEKLLGTDTLILKTIDKTPTFDIISVLRFTEPVTMQAYVLKTVDKTLITDILYKDTNESTYEMDVKIQETIVYDILHNTERFNPQYPAIGLNYMKRAYPIFDSREEVKE